MSYLDYSELRELGIEVHPDIPQIAAQGGQVLLIDNLSALDNAVTEEWSNRFLNPIDNRPVCYPTVMDVLALSDEQVRTEVDREWGLNSFEPWPFLVLEGPAVMYGYQGHVEPDAMIVRPWNVRPIDAVGVELARVLCSASRSRITDSLYDMACDLWASEGELAQYGEDPGTYPPDLEDDEMHPEVRQYWMCIEECLKAGLIKIHSQDPFIWSDTPTEVTIGPMKDYLHDVPADLAYWEEFERRSRRSSANALRSVERHLRNQYIWTERYYDPWVSLLQ